MRTTKAFHLWRGGVQINTHMLLDRWHTHTHTHYTYHHEHCASKHSIEPKPHCVLFYTTFAMLLQIVGTILWSKRWETDQQALIRKMQIRSSRYLQHSHLKSQIVLIRPCKTKKSENAKWQHRQRAPLYARRYTPFEKIKQSSPRDWDCACESVEEGLLEKPKIELQVPGTPSSVLAPSSDALVVRPGAPSSFQNTIRICFHLPTKWSVENQCWNCVGERLWATAHSWPRRVSHSGRIATVLQLCGLLYTVHFWFLWCFHFVHSFILLALREKRKHCIQGQWGRCGWQSLRSWNLLLKRIPVARSQKSLVFISKGDDTCFGDSWLWATLLETRSY